MFDDLISSDFRVREIGVEEGTTTATGELLKSRGSFDLSIDEDPPHIENPSGVIFPKNNMDSGTSQGKPITSMFNKFIPQFAKKMFMK
jgi:hypothetical protein